MINKLIVHGIVKIDDKYLVIKRSVIKRGEKNMYPDYWDIPGGSVEPGELPREALAREILEEVNLHAIVTEIVHEDSNYDKGKNTVFTRLVYTCEIVGEQVIMLDKEEHTQYKEISSIQELEGEKMVPYLLSVLL